MRTAHTILMLTAVLSFTITRGQVLPAHDSLLPHFNRVTDLNPRLLQQHDTLWIYSGICKPLKKVRFTGNEASYIADSVTDRSHPASLFTIHGNVQYDFLYRSFADTPYYLNDFRQHTLQTSLAIVVKDKYPLRVNFQIRKSNSPYFKNFLDGGLQFDKYNYEKNIRQQLADKIQRRLMNRPDLREAEEKLRQKLDEYERAKTKLNSPDVSQRIIEEREKEWYKRQGLPAAERPSLTDSASSGFQKLVDDKKQQLDSLEADLAQLSSRIDSIKNAISRKSSMIREKIYKASRPQELDEIAAENGVTDAKETKLDRFLSHVKSIGVGRNMLNYSELTVQNVSLTGVNIEYNPRIYLAFAAGKVDYGFRDFFGRNTRRAGQHLVLGRIGIGDKDKKALILSVFTGKKVNYGSVFADSVNGSFNVTGYSVEAIIKKDQNTGISAEVAKSTRPLTGRYTDNKELGSLFRFTDRTNLGISIKGQTIIRETNTRLSGFFRKTGENFQSFSLFTYNTDQTSWAMKADQSFAKDRINLIAMLRRNDFVNPFTEKTFKTSTVFTSVQLAVRFPKWPSLSVGYYPGSQLYIIDRERVRENVYYILNGTLVHNYKLLGMQMVSSAIYNQYTTRGTDSGFINYNGINYMLSHSLLLKKAQLQGNFIYTDQQELQFFTVEGNADYAMASFLRLGAGIKYNKVLSGQTYWGGRAQVMIETKKLGGIQLQYEKSFLPTIYQTLFPVELGRVSWFKYF